MTPSVYFPLISELDPTFGLLEVSCLFCTARINLFMRIMVVIDDMDCHHPHSHPGNKSEWVVFIIIAIVIGTGTLQYS